MLNRKRLRMMACSSQPLRNRKVPELLQLRCEHYDRSQPEQPSDVATNLVADFISSFATNPLVAIVQSVDKSSHDFRIAVAVELVTQFVNRFRTVLGVAGSL